MINVIIKKRFNLKMYILIFLALVCFILLSSLVKAPPPEPHNVEGYVFNNNSGNGAGGLPVRINNTVTGDVILTYTLLEPPIFPFLGKYSATIDGNDGDLINITSWNATHWGFNATTLAATTTFANITLNITRNSEANVTIIEPLNNTLKNKSIDFNVTANITILGNDGVDCNATISFSDNSIINISSGENFTHILGNIAFENYKMANWSVRGINDGSSAITVSANCASDGVNLEYRNSYTVSNITIQNLAPVISNLAIDSPIDLQAGSNLTILCNASINDDNTISDINIVNATFFQESVGFDAVDDNNDHYTNSSCVNVSSSAFQSNYTCGFKVAYYANNGTWQCNITASDNSNITAFDSISASINQLLAIDVSPTIIDYGKLQVTNTSSTPINTTIKNLGNIPFNLTLRGFGGDNESIGQNVTMICDFGNITFGNQRYSVGINVSFDNMKNLTNQTVDTNFTFFQRTNDLAFGNDTNTTFWKLQIPVLRSGICNGTVIFGAIPTS
jgi:hypothetical protein